MRKIQRKNRLARRAQVPVRNSRLRFGTQRLRTADAAITEYHSKLQKTIKNSKKAALSALQQALSAASFVLIG